MSRWIDADAMKKQVESPYTEYPIMIQIRKTLKDFIDDAPSIDIVRCKECKHWEMRNSPRGWCVVHQGYVSPQYFCADGERSRR